MISIIIPVYNSEHTLQRCLNSVYCQSYKLWELIIVDDGSTDDSEKIIYENKEKHPDYSIKTIYQENKGVSSARNAGIKVASGEFITFVDSDDILLKDGLQILFDEQEKHAADIVFGNMCYYDGRHYKVKNRKEYYFDSVKEMKPLYGKLYLNFIIHHASGTLYKKSFICEKFDETMAMGEDLDFNLRNMARARGILICSKNVYQYNKDNEGAATCRFDPIKIEKAKIVYAHAVDDAKTIFGEDYFPQVENTLLVCDTMRAIQNYVHFCRNRMSEKKIQEQVNIWLDDDEIIQASVEMYSYNKYFVIKSLIQKKRIKLLIKGFMIF